MQGTYTCSQAAALQVIIFGGCSTDRCAKLTDASPASWRTDLTDQRGSWLREEMPAPRVMPWSCLLPDGTVFVMGGAENGETCPVTRFWMGSARGCTLSGCPVPDRELDCQPWMLPRLHAHL